MIGIPTPQVVPSPWKSRTCTGFPAGVGFVEAAADDFAGSASQAPPDEDPPPPQAASRPRVIPATANRHVRELLMPATMPRTGRVCQASACRPARGWTFPPGRASVFPMGGGFVG